MVDPNPRADRGNPLRVLFDQARNDKQRPKRDEIEEIPLVEDTSQREAREFADRVDEYATEIVAAARGGQNSEAVRLIESAMDELSEYVDPDAKASGGDPRANAREIPRAGSPARRSRVDVEHEDALSRIAR